MFRSKRTALVKRLWKFRTTNNETTSENESEEDLEIKSVVQSMLKRLKEKQLETLIQSVESKGGETTECVLLPNGALRLGRRSVAPHILCCQVWRWPTIVPEATMKQLPCCSTKDDPAYICCNPYHWSLLLSPDPDMPIPNHFERVKISERLGLEIPDSTETGMTPPHHRQSYTDDTSGCSGPHWCSIAYWEHRERVGRLLTVSKPSINVFQDLPHGDGMCLSVLQQTDDVDEHVRRTREKIGFGLTLSKEDDGVWAYNRSQYPFFVYSPTLDLPNSRTFLVHKVPLGYSIKIYDYDKAELFNDLRDPQLLDGPFDPSSIQISFAKGWGSCYSRQFITSCPCRIEVLLNVNR